MTVAVNQGQVHRPPKPKFRGVLHHVAFYLALLATALLVVLAPSSKASFAAAIYGATLTAQFGISALYHVPNWPPQTRQWLRRADHSAIFLLIAGTYTPLFWLLDPNPSRVPLFVVWVGAALGITKSMLWPNAPKPVTVIIYLTFGLAVIGDVIRLAPNMGSLALALLVAGGVVYSVGAVIYAWKRPNPLPDVFGYHEIFHSLVLVASAIHFVHVVRVIQTAS